MSKRIHRVTQHRSGIPGVEAMTLFSNHEFPRHSHDHFGIGVMTAGAQRSWSIVGQVESRAGDVIMCNPGEMHDGIPAGPGGPERGARGWRILYFAPSLMDDDVSQEERGELIVPPVVRDPRLAANVASLFALLLAGGQALKSRKMHHWGQVTADLSPTLQNAKNQGLAPMKHLAVEEALVGCLMQVSERHRLGRRADVPTSPSVAAAICRLDDAPELPITLTELASLSGVSRFQLLRGFAREVGTTPHAYVIQRRARLARQHLAAGKSPADAALLAGFADQSHLTRAFVRHFGVTPARYRAVVSRNFVQDE